MINIKQSRNIFIIIIFFIALFFTTVVYSAFNTQLQIKGEAIVRSEQMFRITDLRLIEATNDAYETYNSKYEKDSTSLYVKLPKSSKMTYEVTVSNKYNELIYSLQEILPLINNNSNVEVVYSINVGDCVNSNENKTFTITLTNNTESEQSLTLITQYRFELANWTPLETKFLSSSDTGDLSVNKDGVIFEISVKNSNSFNVNYSLTSDNYRFIVVDDVTKDNKFQIEPNTTVTHQIRVTLRDDVAYEHFTENLKLMVKTTSPLSSTTDIKTVVLNLPRRFSTILLNSMPVEDSPINFSSAETTNGYLYRIHEMTTSTNTYFYRGVINNNYFLFADNLWRIVRVDSTGHIRLVLNDNVSSKAQYNQNYVSGYVENLESAISLIDYRNSNVRTAVEEWYNQNIAPNEKASKYVVDSKFCIDTSYQDPFETQYENTVYYFTPYLHVGIDSHNFTPDFSCSEDHIFTSSVGLLNAEEILAAGGYWDTPNTNYYLYNPNKTDDQTSWTLSGSYYSIYEKQAGVIVFNQTDRGLFDWVLGGNIAQHYGYRPVISIYINEDTIVLGDGTIDKPYQISE